MRRVLTASVALLFLAGCNSGGGPVFLAVVRQGDPFPPNVKSVAVLPFAPKDAASNRYCDMTGQLLAARLDETIGPRGGGPVTVLPVALADFSKLPGLAGADLADPATAAKAAKALKVDAALFGTVQIQQQQPPPGPLPMGTRVPPLVVSATVIVQMVEVQTGQIIMPPKTLNGSVGTRAGAPEQPAPPMDGVTAEAIRRAIGNLNFGPSGLVGCMATELAGGKSDLAKEARELALAGQYADAAEAFDKAVADRPDDHGSMYNFGLMKLLLGDLPGGRAEINKAIQLKPEKDYMAAAANLDHMSRSGNVQVRAATPAERAACGVKVKSAKAPKKPKPTPVKNAGGETEE